MRWFAMVVVLAAVLSSTAARSQESADVRRGLTYARAVCAECHGVEAMDEGSPNAVAPTFKAVANTPGMTKTALIVWMQSNHRSMPNFIVPVGDRDAVIDYILGLKDNPSDTSH